MIGMVAVSIAWGIQESTGTVQESTNTLEITDVDQTHMTQESEAKGIIPDQADVLSSTQPVTPISEFTEKSPYEQARSELIRALDLLNSDHFEAASDTALEAYEDFSEIRRVPGVKRSQIRALTHQAASVYVEASIAYVKNYLRRAGRAPDALEEARSRLEDLRDVARNYRELNKMLNAAIESLGH